MPLSSQDQPTTNRRTLTQDTFVRNLPPMVCRQLAERLDIGNMWERLAVQIPRRPEALLHNGAEFVPRYSTNSLAKFSNKNRKHEGSATKSLLTDWGTQNSQVKHLLIALKQACLLEAAAYIEQRLEQQNPCTQQNLSMDSQSQACPSPSQVSSHGQSSANPIQVSNHSQSSANPSSLPSVPVVSKLPNCWQQEPRRVISQATGSPQVRDENWQDRTALSQTGTRSDQMSYFSEPCKPGSVGDAPPSQDVSGLPGEEWPFIPGQDQLQKIDIKILRRISNGFDLCHLEEGGRMIGEGGFGNVFLGTFQNDHQVAIKVLKQSTEDTLEQFKTEVETLSTYKHENVVLLLGYSIEDDMRCLIYKYMPNGSLEERLACRFGSQPLSAAMRLNITRGTARGVAFLNEGGLVHRDIKTANILLDTHFNPKVGDFATAKLYPSEMTKTFTASSVIGTASYLAPEALNFKITIKLDSYSFGVVLLEILTGLPVLDPNREEVDLKTHVREHCCPSEEGSDSDEDKDEPAGTIFDLLDAKAGNWDPAVVSELYSVSCRCLAESHQRRPTVADILPNLEKLVPRLEGGQKVDDMPTKSGE